MVFRILNFLNRSTTELQVQFSAPLNPNISINNVEVNASISNVSSLIVKSTSIDSDTITITTSPQSEYVRYYVLFSSTDSQSFVDVDDNLLQEDGANNRIDFLGLEKDNTIRDAMIDSLPPIYNMEEDTLVRKHMASLAKILLKAKSDIREVGNANYISEEVVDEIVTRGTHNSDRLLNEGAYLVTRVGTSPTGAPSRALIRYEDDRAIALLSSDYEKANLNIRTFPSDPISLKAVAVISEIVSNEEVLENKFENTLITLSKSNVIQVNAIKLHKSNGNIIVYDIPRYGYSLSDNRYDEVGAFKLSTLDSNQFKLSDAAILEGDFEVPTGSDELEVSYLYMDSGINVDSSTIQVAQIVDITRESVGAYLTTFFLQNFPIVTASDDIPTLNGVSFLDPDPDSGSPFTETHPAFETELVYSASRLPSATGEYAVNYETGQVFVYGESIADGSGPNPPVATYKYRKSYIEDIDYVFDEDTDEIAALSNRDLIGETVHVSYNYESALAEGTDFSAEVHNEVIDERVDNRLVSTFRIATAHSPITNVFRIFNETTGELYFPTRFDDNFITFSGRNSPKVSTATNEIANFKAVYNEPLLVSAELSNNSILKTISFSLTSAPVIGETNDCIGSNINSSINFSLPDVFVNEFYYDSLLQTVSQNLAKLSSAGDYLINYNEGIVYLLTESNTVDFGEISYKHATIGTVRNNILAPESIAYKAAVDGTEIATLSNAGFDSETITVDGLVTAERFLNNDIDRPITFGAKLSGISGQKTISSATFIALDGRFDSSHADGNHILRFADDSDRTIISVVSLTTVIVDVPFTETEREVAWTLIDFDISDEDGYNTTVTYDIQSIRSIYAVSDLQTLAYGSLTNIYDSSVDTFDGNVITFNNDTARSISPGTALIVDYQIGNIYVDYTYVADNLLVTYEYGDNSINHGSASVLDVGDKYYVSYKYGALRDALLTNFGSLTQIDELADFPHDFNRELYRGAVGGALQAFVKGPTVGAIKTAVSSMTDVEPEVRELDFNEWTLGRDNLYLQKGRLTGPEIYSDGKFGSGLVISDDTTLSFPAEAYISLREGTFEAWIRPEWRGHDNDATLTFNIGEDGYLAEDGYGLLSNELLSLDNIFIGASAFNPTEVPFNLHRDDEDPYSPIGRPYNFGIVPGFFIWYDSDLNRWELKAVGDPDSNIVFTGTITSSGQFYSVDDGYSESVWFSINEVSDAHTTTTSTLSFSLSVDGYEVDGYYDGYDGYTYFDGEDGYFQDGLTFSSDDLHYIFDTGRTPLKNRLSVYKDGVGYLNFRIIDAYARQFSISSNISDWLAEEMHFIAASWRLNSADGVDEMHLFLDGQEVSNNFKYGGRPQAGAGALYRTVADEILTLAAPKNIISAADGTTVAGSSQIISDSSDFIEAGIVAGDTVTILDSTVDSTIDRVVVSVIDANTLDVDIAFILSLDNVRFSVNQMIATTATMLNNERIAIFTTDLDDVEVELSGTDAEEPDYEIDRDGHDHIVRINNGVAVGDSISIHTLGLTRGRVRDLVWNYSTDYILRTNLEQPLDLSDVDIYKVFVRRTSIVDDGYLSKGNPNIVGQWATSGSQIDGYFTGICDPSNIVAGKKLRITLSGTDNIDFSGTNQITIWGTMYGGGTFEIVTFDTYETVVTTQFFKTIHAIEASFSGIDVTKSFGALEIIEDVPFTVSENNGDYAQVVSYDNGNFSLTVYGSGGDAFELEQCHYLLDFPTRLNINVANKGELFIGSDLSGTNQLSGVIDDVIFLNEMLTDVRTGEIPASGLRTITSDYNTTREPENTAQTLMLLDMNDNIGNVDTYYKTYIEDYLTNSRSVNLEFGDCAVFYDNNPLIIDNGPSIVKNDSGTVEFWVSPFIDTYNDLNSTRYFLDISTITIEEVLSITATTLRISQRARKIRSVRLITDEGFGTDYFEGGSLGLDGRTITLGSRLPGQFTRVEVQYISVNSAGDRISIYKDGYNSLNFEILADEEVYNISYPIAWQRNSWHRIMATWDLNNIDNQDRIRLFIDGVESGTITYGTPGLLYGIGIIYGSVAVGGLDSDFLTADINLTDTFADIVVGNSFDGRYPAKARMDNLRFSTIAREPATVAGVAVDLNYIANLEAALPVIEDDFTSAIYDFDKEIVETEFLANLLRRTTPLFTFDVDVIDSFRKIDGNERARDLIESLINRIKPAHSSAFVRFLE